MCFDRSLPLYVDVMQRFFSGEAIRLRGLADQISRHSRDQTASLADSERVSGLVRLLIARVLKPARVERQDV